MTKRVEVFYSFQSPYSYLAIESIYELDRDFDIELLWQPFSARAAGQQIPPQPVLSEKVSYLFEDTRRYAEDNNIPLTFPEHWPEVEFDPTRITRGALVAQDMGVLMEYHYKVFHKWWGEGEDPNEDMFLSDLAEELDINFGEFLNKLSNSDTRERVKGIYRRGRKLAVFDTPTFVLEDKERIVGIDKIPYLRQRLAAEGLKKKR